MKSRESTAELRTVAETALRTAVPEREISVRDEVSIELPKRRRSVRRVFLSLPLLSFLALVILPSVAATIYYAFIASRQYTVEARFVVRQNNENETPSPSKLLGQMNSMSSSTSSLGGMSDQDAYVVASYIRSRAMVDDISKILDLRRIFRRPGTDFVSRLERDATIERLVEYWRDQVTTYIDGPSGIVTLQVRAFRPEDALAIAQAVDTLSEKLADQISVRARRDAVARAQQDVDQSENTMRSIIVDMEKYRDREGMISPLASAQDTGSLLKEVLGERIKIDSELFVEERLSPGSPTLPALRARRSALDSRIAELQAKLTGRSQGDHPISASLVKFEELSVDEKLAERLYGLARDELQRARQTAEKRSVYLTVFVPPALPQKSYYPRRAAFSALVALALLVFWSVGALTWASVRDHRL